ncbi:MerR family transcriptional regulator [Cytobacillus gottheilii]|uniref:MerR family transcriptional regulator n=1 Tax=Cytobacillus gottheilii TaxID=859144 RepID=UPI0021472ABA|nr:MerR family transcriptional regulator [Cytobacillus gottheilii]
MSNKNFFCHPYRKKKREVEFLYTLKEGKFMNTTKVARLLNVSKSTVQRWVKQLDLQMKRNELGHYSFSEDDVALLTQVHEQLQAGKNLQEISVTSKQRRNGIVKKEENDPRTIQLLKRIDELELRINRKADDVVSYQLLQHRQEMEELQKQITSLNERMSALEATASTLQNIPPTPQDTLLLLDQEKPQKKLKRKSFFTMLFG